MLQSPSNFGNLVAFKEMRFIIPQSQVENYWKEIVTTGAPSKSDLISEMKNFFEGPINMDFMIAGALKNILEQQVQQGDNRNIEQQLRDLLVDLKSGGTDLLTTLVISQQAVMALDVKNDIEEAYIYLKEYVEPKIYKICIDQSSI